MNVDIGVFHGLWTLLLLIVFIAIVAWAWSASRRQDFDEAARIPLEKDEQDVLTPPPGGRA